MKKITAAFIIFIFTISSVFAINVKVGAAMITHSDMQTAPYREYREGDRLCVWNARTNTLYSYDGIENSFLDEDMCSPLYNIQLSDLVKMGAATASYNVNFAPLPINGGVNNYSGYLHYDSSLSLPLGTANIALEFNGEKYTTPSGMFEDYMEIGASFNTDSYITEHLHIQLKGGAYSYPIFRLGNAYVTDVRQASFSTAFDATLRFTSDYFNFYIGAGLKSWQIMKDLEIEKISDLSNLIGGFLPSQIRNSFNAGVDVGFENFKLFVDYTYFCDHPEATYSHLICGDIEFTNNNFGLLTAGFEFTL